VAEEKDEKLEFLKREEIRTMGKDVAKLREEEARKEQGRVTKLSTAEKEKQEREKAERIRKEMEERKSGEEKIQREREETARLQTEEEAKKEKELAERVRREAEIARQKEEEVKGERERIARLKADEEARKKQEIEERIRREAELKRQREEQEKREQEQVVRIRAEEEARKEQERVEQIRREAEEKRRGEEAKREQEKIARIKREAEEQKRKEEEARKEREELEEKLKRLKAQGETKKEQERVERIRKETQERMKTEFEAQKKAEMPAERKRLFIKPSSRFEKILIRFLLFILIILPLAFLFTFWFWYLVVREGQSFPFLPRETATEETRSQETTRTVFPAEETRPGQELVIPPSLIPVEDTRTITISPGQDIRPLLSQVLKENFGENRFTRIVIVDAENNKVFGLGDFFTSFLVKTPTPFYDHLSDNFTLFAYSVRRINRLGLIAEVKNREGFSELLSQWETTMEQDTEPLFAFLGKKGSPIISNFRSIQYVGTVFRYQTISLDDFGICYTFTKDHFVLTSSLESIFITTNRLLNI